jgi:adenylate kinase
MRLILVGPPGSGKGTQAKLLSSRLKLVHIGTGDILREAIQKKTPLGKQAKPYIESGRLVPDDLVNEVIAERFHQPDRPENFVMDGYPRTLAQAAAFDQVLRQEFLDLNAVVFILVDDEEIVRRMSGRWSCKKCKSTYHMVNNPPRVPGICDLDGMPLHQREDDREETVRKRLQVYHENTGDLIRYYREKQLLREVPGLGSIEEIYDRIVRVLSQGKRPC